jgi:hypothetical protein
VHSNFEGLIEIGVLNIQNMTQATWVLGPIQPRNFQPVLWIRDPVLFWPMDQGSGMGKKSGSGIIIPDHFPESIETVFCVKNI